MPDPVEQQNIVQDTNPLAILANDEEIENGDNKAQQVIPDQIKNQGAEDAINANKNDFESNQEDQGAPQKIQGAQKDHGNWGAWIKVKDVLEGKLNNELDSDEEETESRKEDRERRSTYFNTPTEEEYGRGKLELKQST